MRSLFEQTGDLDALNQGVALGREAAYTAVEDNPARAFYSSVFAQSLRTKFEHTGEQADIVEAIRMWRLALQLLPPDQRRLATWRADSRRRSSRRETEKIWMKRYGWVVRHFT